MNRQLDTRWGILRRSSQNGGRRERPLSSVTDPAVFDVNQWIHPQDAEQLENLKKVVGTLESMLWTDQKVLSFEESEELFFDALTLLERLKRVRVQKTFTQHYEEFICDIEQLVMRAGTVSRMEEVQIDLREPGDLR
jgi:hypothetical protein